MLAAPDRDSPGPDGATMPSSLTAVQTGLRLSEMTGLKRDDLDAPEAGAHVRVIGKGRKERCIPLSKSTRASVLKAWLRGAAKRGQAWCAVPQRQEGTASVCMACSIC